jgi:hypothetical protein
MESPREIAELVPMPELLAALGIPVNTRSHRAPCILHGGSNPTAFSWRDDGRWYCFSCGKGGDKFALVMAVRDCSFREALGFVAEMAGVELNGGTSKKLRNELDTRRRERERLEAAAEMMRVAENIAFRDCQDELGTVKELERNVSARMNEIYRSEQKGFDGEMECCWEALSILINNRRNAEVAYTIAGFADTESRAQFALGSTDDREEMIWQTLERGT